MTDQESWLPNLVGGVSIWKLAIDLNDPKFMDGRLLEPETEGSDSLPAKVTWDLTGMLPLAEARAAHPEKIEAAIADFFACLERVSEQLEDESSGYHKFREAFTVPGLDADGGAHYFYDVASHKLNVINWGASPRSIKQKRSFLFGYDSFRDLYQKEGIEPAAMGVGAGAIAAAVAGTENASLEPAVETAPEAQATGDASPAAKKESQEEEKKEEGGEEAEGRPWWFWVLVVAGVIVLVVAILLLLQECNPDKTQKSANADNSGLVDGADAGATDVDAGLDAGTDAGALATGGKGGAGGAGGGGGKGGGGGAGGKGGAGGDGGSDGQGGSNGQGGSKGQGGGPPGPPTPAPGVVPGGGAGTAGGNVIIVPSRPGPVSPVPMPAGDVHRAHDQPGAIAWRVAKGYQNVSDALLSGTTYHVFLKPGVSFNDITVQWQDRNGKWHNH